MTTPEVHRAHVEELRSLANQIREANQIGSRAPAMQPRLAAVEYAIGILEASPPRNLTVVVGDGGHGGDDVG